MTQSLNLKIDIKVKTQFIEQDSEPEKNRYLFAYMIRIENSGDQAAKLMSRKWIIHDSDGKLQEVEGSGVIGQQPHLEPGEHFEYTSGVLLETPVGIMQGSYRMLSDDGIEFEAPIKPFRLSVPNSIH